MRSVRWTQTDMMKLIVAFRNFANAPKNYIQLHTNTRRHLQLNLWLINQQKKKIINASTIHFLCHNKTDYDSYSLRAGRLGVRNSVESRFTTPVKTDTRCHSTFCAMVRPLYTFCAPVWYSTLGDTSSVYGGVHRIWYSFLLVTYEFLIYCHYLPLCGPGSSVGIATD